MRKIFILLIAIFVFIFGIASSFGQTAKEEARRHLDRAMVAVEMAKTPDDYAPAIREFEQAIELAPNWSGLYYNLGLVQEKAGDFGEAVKNLQLYLRFAPHASDAETVKSLINKLEYKFELSAAGDTLLHEAAIKGKKRAIELLLADGADINASDNGDNTPLHDVIITMGQKEVVGLLITKGADINIKNEYGCTPLHYAVRGGQKEIIELLIAKGADINARDKNLFTPLHEAAVVGGQKEIVELLIAKGAEINAADSSGYTPLHYTVAHCRVEVAELLIVKGADMNIENNEGMTPLQLAESNNYKEVGDLLRKHGAK